MPTWALNLRRLERPGSITKRTPGTVTEVSAMLVARIIFRVSGGGGANALYWRWGGRAANRGHIIN